jgi:hypothetical protein
LLSRRLWSAWDVLGHRLVGDALGDGEDEIALLRAHRRGGEEEEDCAAKDPGEHGFPEARNGIDRAP